MARAAKDKTDLSLVDKIELARVYQAKVNRGIFAFVCASAEMNFERIICLSIGLGECENKV